MTGSDNTLTHRPCILLLGGSFDPVHTGHIALANHFIQVLQPDELRIIPAGNPWQKSRLQASADDRIAMIERAFAAVAVPVAIDDQEIRRPTPSYTVDTLRNLRTAVGSETSLVFLMGGDQLQRLHTWRDWHKLFAYAHVAAASRPGFPITAASLAPALAEELETRSASAEQLRQTSHGHILITNDLAVDVSSTALRNALQHQQHAISQLPPAVLDYIEQHHLYRN